MQSALRLSRLLVMVTIAAAGCDKSRLDQTEADWNAVRTSNTAGAYEEFISKHPESSHVAEATSAIARLHWSSTLAIVAFGDLGISSDAKARATFLSGQCLIVLDTKPQSEGRQIEFNEANTFVSDTAGNKSGFRGVQVYSFNGAKMSIGDQIIEEPLGPFQFAESGTGQLGRDGLPFELLWINGAIDKVGALPEEGPAFKYPPLLMEGAGRGSKGINPPPESFGKPIVFSIPPKGICRVGILFSVPVARVAEVSVSGMHWTIDLQAVPAVPPGIVKVAGPTLPDDYAFLRLANSDKPVDLDRLLNEFRETSKSTNWWIKTNRDGTFVRLGRDSVQGLRGRGLTTDVTGDRHIWKPEPFECYRDDLLLGIWDPVTHSLRRGEATTFPGITGRNAANVARP